MVHGFTAGIYVAFLWAAFQVYRVYWYQYNTLYICLIELEVVTEEADDVAADKDDNIDRFVAGRDSK